MKVRIRICDGCDNDIIIQPESESDRALLRELVRAIYPDAEGVDELQIFRPALYAEVEVIGPKDITDLEDFQ